MYYVLSMKNKLLRLVKKGKSTREIAEVLGISQAGVRYHLKKHGLRTERKAGRPSTKSLQTKGDFLGMPWGTAANKLRRLLLFKYVKLARNGRIECWNCEEEIEDASQLSMQHKKPWLHENRELFWDLDNITFAHRKCNKPDRNRNSEKTHCPAGHEYTVDSVRLNKGKSVRICRICVKEQTRDRMRKARAKDPKYGR